MLLYDIGKEEWCGAGLAELLMIYLCSADRCIAAAWILLGVQSLGGRWVAAILVSRYPTSVEGGLVESPIGGGIVVVGGAIAGAWYRVCPCSWSRLSVAPSFAASMCWIGSSHKI